MSEQDQEKKESKEQQKRNLIPSELHFIALPLFLLALFVSYRHYRNPDSTESVTYLIMLPLVVGALPYLALFFVYLTYYAWALLLMLKNAILIKLNNLWRD
jgi:hypothetical protein